MSAMILAAVGWVLITVAGFGLIPESFRDSGVLCVLLFLTLRSLDIGRNDSTTTETENHA